MVGSGRQIQNDIPIGENYDARFEKTRRMDNTSLMAGISQPTLKLFGPVATSKFHSVQAIPTRGIMTLSHSFSLHQWCCVGVVGGGWVRCYAPTTWLAEERHYACHTMTTNDLAGLLDCFPILLSSSVYTINFIIHLPAITAHFQTHHNFPV